MSTLDPRLRGIRLLIDRLDAGIVALAAARRGAVGLAAVVKPRGSARDSAREVQVHAHAARVGVDLGLPRSTAQRLMSVLVQDACTQQGYDALTTDDSPTLHADGPDLTRPDVMNSEPIHRLAALLPPPRVLMPLLARVPAHWHAALLQRAMRHALEGPVRAGEFDFLADHTIGIEVTDLGLRWSISVRDGRLCVVDAAPEASVKGTVTDLMLLASRAEDADTLFFQRRLTLTGDTELGLVARNTLDRLDWQAVPLGLRVLLNRAARHASATRAAWRERLASRLQPAGTASNPGPPRQ